MKNKWWMYLLVIAAASFGITFLADILMNSLSGVAGLLIMGMLVFGWPGTAVWLGMEAGKDLKKRWYLPVLFALTMPFVFPYYRAYLMAGLYAGGMLVIGLLTMICTKVTE